VQGKRKWGDGSTAVDSKVLYCSWAEKINMIPYPRSWNLSLEPQRRDGGVGWGGWSVDSGGFEEFQGRFYTSSGAQDIYQTHLDKVVNRKNSINGRLYKEDATIMTWEPINEPQLTADEGGEDAMIKWHNKIAKHIKSVAPRQLVSTGFEAKQGSVAYNELHRSRDVDYGCAHMWPQIWGQYDMLDPSRENVERALRWTSGYILEVEGYAREVGKPIVLEEFGMPRDNWLNTIGGDKYLYDTSATTTSRDAIFSSVFDLVSARFKAKQGLVGAMPWSYGGLYRSAKQKYNNQGILIAGDPPQERE
jgi:mannan endo-1,4-beta-mannosidase